MTPATWKINQMSSYAPGYTGPMTTAGPVKPRTTGPKTLTPGMPTPVKPRGPLAVGPKPLPPKTGVVKPKGTPRGPRGTGPNDGGTPTVRPPEGVGNGPKIKMPLKSGPKTYDPGYMAKGGAVKKGMAYGGMAKAPVSVAKAPAKPMPKSMPAMPKSMPAMPKAMPKGKTSIMKKGMAMGGMAKKGKC